MTDGYMWLHHTQADTVVRLAMAVNFVRPILCPHAVTAHPHTRVLPHASLPPHHPQDKMDPTQLQQVAATNAIWALSVANLPGLLPRD